MTNHQRATKNRAGVPDANARNRDIKHLSHCPQHVALGFNVAKGQVLSSLLVRYHGKVLLKIVVITSSP